MGVVQQRFFFLGHKYEILLLLVLPPFLILAVTVHPSGKALGGAERQHRPYVTEKVGEGPMHRNKALRILREDESRGESHDPQRAREQKRQR